MARPSSRFVAVASRTIPAAWRASIRSGDGRPKWKLTTFGPLFQEHGEHGVVLDEAPVDLPELPGGSAP